MIRTTAWTALAAWALASAPPRAMAQSAPTPKFEVASVKRCRTADADGGGRGGGGSVGGSPGRLSAGCQTVEDLIRAAYLRFPNGQPWPVDAQTGIRIPPVSLRILAQPIKGGPGWIESDRYTVDARAESPQSMEMMRGPMMQALLEDRFKLKIHQENREVPIFELTVAKGGPKLQPAKEGNCIPFDRGHPPAPAPGHLPPAMCGGFFGQYVYGTTMANFCRQLSAIADRDVIDKTGIAGAFDIHLEYSPADFLPDASAGATPTPADQATSPGFDGAAFFAAIQKALPKLGLKLEPAKGSGDFLVIDHVERPSEN